MFLLVWLNIYPKADFLCNRSLTGVYSPICSIPFNSYGPLGFDEISYVFVDIRALYLVSVFVVGSLIWGHQILSAIHIIKFIALLLFIFNHIKK